MSTSRLILQQLVRICPWLLLHNSFQDGFPGFFPHICLMMQVTTCESRPLERVIIIIIIGVLFCFFPCSSKPLWVVSRVFWGCQSSLLAKKSPPRMLPHDMKAWSPEGLGEAHPADLQLPPVCGGVPRRIRQGWANSRSSFEGPAVLWYSRAQGSHIISANITVARHLSSSVSFVHKTSFCSIRFNRHLLNICAVSDHVQGTRTAKMNNTGLGLPVMLVSRFIIPKATFQVSAHLSQLCETQRCLCSHEIPILQMRRVSLKDQVTYLRLCS